MRRELQPARPRWMYFAVPGLWLLFGLMVIAISWGGAASRNRPFDFANTVVWNVGWLWWAAATMGVWELGRRFPIERRRLGGMLTLHAAFGVVVTMMILALEFGVNEVLRNAWPATIRPNPFVGFFVYKFHIYFLIYGLILGTTGAYDYYARLQRIEVAATQLEARLAQAQVQALKMQLHPHFLFNTHHAIVSLMLKNENSAAIKMLTRLSDLLRVTLEKNNQAMNPLREELATLDLYLGIQRERYGDRLVVEMNIADDVLDVEVPALLLQPLVENALQHGIDAHSDQGRVVIDARRSEGRVALVVRDNGRGLSPDFSLGEGNGVGLSNTRARLHCLYGDRQHFEIRSIPSGGTEVRLSFPWSMPATASESAAEPASVQRA